MLGTYIYIYNDLHLLEIIHSFESGEIIIKFKHTWCHGYLISAKCSISI